MALPLLHVQAIISNKVQSHSKEHASTGLHMCRAATNALVLVTRYTTHQQQPYFLHCPLLVYWLQGFWGGHWLQHCCWSSLQT
jgi:hypothetical protein